MNDSFKWILFLLAITSTLPKCFAEVVKDAAGNNASISCYSCESFSDSNSNCTDEAFNPSSDMFIMDCKMPKRHHSGIFPAKYCLKVFGKHVETGKDFVIRACSLEESNRCGAFQFNGNFYEGCAQTCNYDGCNGAENNYPAFGIILTLWAMEYVLL